MKKLELAQDATWMAAEYIEDHSKYILGEQERAELTRAIIAIINGKQPTHKLLLEEE